MKKLLILSSFLLILASCGWSSTATDDSSVTSISWTWFSMNVPKSWTNVEQKALPNTKNGKIEIAYTSSEISAWFANNLVVLSENLTAKTTSLEYGITNYVRTTWSVLDYLKLSETNFKFSDGDESKIYTFEAKYSASTPKRKFLQTTKVCDSKGYLVTVWINLDNTSTSKYENLLKSFKCVK